jgi:hypothetical protein
MRVLLTPRTRLGWSLAAAKRRTVSSFDSMWLRRAGLVTSVLLLCIVIGSLGVFLQPRLVVAAALGILMVTSALVRPKAAIVLLMIWLPLVGDVRRIVSVELGYSQTDPLLLIGPATAGLLLLQATKRRTLRIDTRLSLLVTLLGALMVVQVVNPAQGGPIVGLGGLFFYLPAVLWFWLGTAYGDPAFVRKLLLFVVVPVGMLASGYAFVQVTAGFPGFQQSWFDQVEYAALNVRGNIRPFAFFPSSAELSTYARIGCVVLIAYAAANRRLSPVLVALPLFAGVFIVGARGSLILLVLALGLCLSVLTRHRQLWLPLLAVSVVAAGLAGRFLLERVALLPASGTTQSIIQHQTGGLLNPFDERESTLVLHLEIMIDGFARAFRMPFGYGTGATSQAADVLGGIGGATEVDISDMFVALGIVGGMLFIGIIVAVLRDGFFLWSARRDFFALAILALTVSMLSAWMTAGQYSTFALLWFLIGALDREVRKERHAHPAGNP